MHRTPFPALAGAVLLVLSVIAAAPARAATVTYTIDPADLNSSLGFLSGNFAGGAASQQPGSVSPIDCSKAWIDSSKRRTLD